MSAIILETPEEINLKKDLFKLSVSKIKTFACPKKYQLQYIIKVKPEGEERDYLVFGKFLHKILEHFHNILNKNEIKKWNEAMSEAYKLGFYEYKDQTTSEQKKEAQEILTNYLVKMGSSEKIKDSEDKHKTKSKFLSFEEPFNIVIDDKILVVGFIDMIKLDEDGIYHVADFKTSKSDKYLKNDYFQLLTYAWYLCLKFPQIEKVRCSYIMLKMNSQYITQEFSRKEIMKMEKEYIEKAKKINKEKLFRPNVTKLCGWCDFSQVSAFCKEGYEFIHKNQKDSLW